MYPKGDVWVQEVIITILTLRGKGTEDNPYRRVTEIWELDGTKIAEIDTEGEKLKQPKP